MHTTQQPAVVCASQTCLGVARSTVCLDLVEIIDTKVANACAQVPSCDYADWIGHTKSTGNVVGQFGRLQVVQVGQMVTIQSRTATPDSNITLRFYPDEVTRFISQVRKGAFDLVNLPDDGTPVVASAQPTVVAR